MGDSRGRRCYTEGKATSALSGWEEGKQQFLAPCRSSPHLLSPGMSGGWPSGKQLSCPSPPSKKGGQGRRRGPSCQPCTPKLILGEGRGMGAGREKAFAQSKALASLPTARSFSRSSTLQLVFGEEVLEEELIDRPGDGGGWHLVDYRACTPLKYPGRPLSWYTVRKALAMPDSRPLMLARLRAMFS